jgi:hypothetical protein
LIGMLRNKMNTLVHLLRRLVDVMSILSLPPRPLSICIDLAYTRSISGCETRPASPQPTQRPSPPPQLPQGNATIHRLMINPTLFDPTRAPRYPIVLCHGMHPCINMLFSYLTLSQDCTDLMRGVPRRSLAYVYIIGRPYYRF